MERKEAQKFARRVLRVRTWPRRRKALLKQREALESLGLRVEVAKGSVTVERTAPEETRRVVFRSDRTIRVDIDDGKHPCPSLLVGALKPKDIVWAFIGEETTSSSD